MGKEELSKVVFLNVASLRCMEFNSQNFPGSMGIGEHMLELSRLRNTDLGSYT